MPVPGTTRRPRRGLALTSACLGLQRPDGGVEDGLAERSVTALGDVLGDQFERQYKCCLPATRAILKPNEELAARAVVPLASAPSLSDPLPLAPSARADNGAISPYLECR
jgi:hypothetical protein